MTALLVGIGLALASPSDEVLLLQSLVDGPPAASPVDLAGSPAELGGLVLHHDDDVAAWVAAYTGPLREPFQRWLGRLDRDRDTLAFLLTSEGLPVGLVAVPVVESGLLPEATSTTGCAGTWQLAAPTAIALGLRVTPDRDDRREPLLAAAAASQLLVELHARFQRWDLVLAAYNAGPQRVVAALAAADAPDWPAVAARLGDEPRHFVAKIHAVLLLDAQRERYGLVAIPPEPP